MAIDPVLRDLFDTTVKITRQTCSHTNGYPTPGYASSGVTYQAKVERSADLVRTEHGHEVVSRRKVFLYSSTGWSSTTIPRTIDKLTLPATHPPREPQIMMIQPVSDENGVNHVVIWC